MLQSPLFIFSLFLLTVFLCPFSDATILHKGQSLETIFDELVHIEQLIRYHLESQTLNLTHRQDHFSHLRDHQPHICPFNSQQELGIHSCFNATGVAAQTVQPLSEVALIQLGPKKIQIFNDRPMVQWVTKTPGEATVRESALQAFEHCQNNDDHPFLVLDVGANLGTYGLLGGMFGCEVVLFDPQPVCQTRILQAIHANGLSETVFLMPFPAGDHEGTLGVSIESGCEGRFPIFQKEPGYREFRETKQVPFVELDRIIGHNQKILWMKVDTEGGEMSVFKGARWLFEHHLIYRATIEITPSFYQTMKLDLAQCGQFWKEAASIPGYTVKMLTPGNLHIVSPDDLFHLISNKKFGQCDFEFTLTDSSTFFSAPTANRSIPN